MSIGESERVRELRARAGLADLSPGAVRWLLLGCAAVVAVTVWRFWPAAPAPEVEFVPDIAAARETATEAGPVADPDVAPATLIVHVAGAVMRPGVYELPLGSRVADALACAGGALDSAAPDAVNLARVLTDGERIHIPTVEEAAAGAGGAAVGAEAVSGAGVVGGVGAGGVVNINTATASELEQLPGVGPATAQKIAEDREKNGPFAVPEDLMRVPGIGPKKFEAMKDLVSCG